MGRASFALLSTTTTEAAPLAAVFGEWVPQTHTAWESAPPPKFPSRFIYNLKSVPMNLNRIAELLAPFLGPANHRLSPDLSGAKGLTDNDLDHISTYIDLLLRWNARINLTAIRDQEEIVTRHFGESLFAARHLFPRTSSVSSVVHDFVDDRVRVADLGSGAGFPALPIKLWAPQISLTLIESNHKKAVFLREVVRMLTLTDVDIQNVRAESLSPAAFDLVTLRAVERFEKILPTAATLVAPSGRLALLIGASQQAVAKSISPHLDWDNPLPIPGSAARMLLVATKNKPMALNTEVD